MLKKYSTFLIAILVLASLLRLYGLSRGDTITDEAAIGFRAVGLVDFMEAAAQTTPFEWFDPTVPWWARLSFHDHPPLVFWIQHIFIRVFGETNFAIRFPSALFGIASVFLLYLIGRKLYGETAGLLGGAALAVTLNSVYISRVGMQEAYVIFFLLAASFLFLHALNRERYFLLTGVVLGLGILAKYNTFILVPIFLSYVLLQRRDVFRKKQFWIGAFLTIIMVSPVIIYNIEMYRAKGHFDFQLSYIFNQPHSEWQEEPGKEIGAFADRVDNFVPRLVATNSWVFLGILAISIFGFLIALLRNFRETLRRHTFLLLVLFWLSLLILGFIGPSYRFLTMLTPFMALCVGIFFTATQETIHARVPRFYFNMIWFLLGATVLIFEIFYSYNNQIAYYPRGPEPWLASRVRYENFNGGYAELRQYFDKEFSGKMPKLTFAMRYKFLEEIQDASIIAARSAGAQPVPLMVVAYGNFDQGSLLWLLARLNIYHAWPIIPLDTYEQYLHENGSDYFERSGFKQYYFLTTTNIAPDLIFEGLVQGIDPILIYNHRGDEVFRIYKKSL